MINTISKQSPILISHRGNLDGPDLSLENNPPQIEKVLKMGFLVEADLWFDENSFYLGHDYPQYKIQESFLQNNNIIWHCKNYKSLEKLSATKLHYFWHNDDQYTITSKGLIWCHITAPAIENSIIVLNDNLFNPSIHLGICSDHILRHV